MGVLALVVAPGTRADTAQGTMRVGLTIVAGQAQPVVPDGAAGGRAAAEEVLCESRDLRYRECRRASTAPARLARVTSDVICIEGGNWGWRGDRVWVDRGCSGVFVSGALPHPVATAD